MSTPRDQNQNQNQTLDARRIGLCVGCTHGRRTVNDRGSVFYRCAYAAIDPAWPKYPPTPVIQCRAFTEEEARES